MAPTVDEMIAAGRQRMIDESTLIGVESMIETGRISAEATVAELIEVLKQSV